MKTLIFAALIAVSGIATGHSDHDGDFSPIVPQQIEPLVEQDKPMPMVNKVEDGSKDTDPEAKQNASDADSK